MNFPQLAESDARGEEAERRERLHAALIAALIAALTAAIVCHIYLAR